MDEDVKQEIQAVLSLLKQTLVKNSVSVAVKKEDGTLCFFDTGKYLLNKEFKGFSINLNDLVK